MNQHDCQHRAIYDEFWTMIDNYSLAQLVDKTTSGYSPDTELGYMCSLIYLSLKNDFGQGQDTPYGHGHQLCEILSRSNLAESSYGPNTDLYIAIFNLEDMTWGQGHANSLDHGQQFCEILFKSYKGEVSSGSGTIRTGKVIPIEPSNYVHGSINVRLIYTQPCIHSYQFIFC